MGKSKVFVIMPFKDEFFEVYEMLKMEFEADFEFSNAGDEGNQQNILKDIIQPIYDADIVIADLTGLNPNVFYELGIAHTLSKKTIIITQDDLSILPFDLKSYRAKNYTTHFKKFEELVEYLKDNLIGASNGSVTFSNPVMDNLIIEKNVLNLLSEKSRIITESDDDNGFLDFLADIEDNSSTLTQNIMDMTSEMQEMTAGVVKSTADIDKVKRTGGSGTTAFVRKEAKKVAGYVENFSIKLREHNKDIPDLWNRIEKNTLGLLENNYSSDKENMEGLVNYLKAIHGIQENIIGNNAAVVTLKNNMQGIIGFERSMNQALRFVIEDLSTYITNMEQIYSSIDRILKKSKLVVGTIDFASTETNQ